jgi:NitT/TauT family transport system substrate-binding protein
MTMSPRRGPKSERTPTRTRGRRLGGVVALGLSATLLAACGGGSGDSASGDSGGGPDKITFLNVLPIETLSFAPELVADTCGQFKEQNLDVTFELTQGSAPGIQTIIAGSAEITRVGDIETIIAAGDKSAPIVNIGTATHRGPIRMVSSTRAPIRSAEDFKGKLVGIPSEGGTSEITLDLILGSAGIPPESVDRQVVGLTPAVFDLVQSGRIDAYVVSLDTAMALAQQQKDAVIFDPSDAIRSGAQNYMTSQEQAEDPQTSDEIKRYMQAIDSAIDFIIKDEKNGFGKTMKCISSKYNVPTLDDKQVARAALAGYVDSWLANGQGSILRTDPEQWQTTYEEMVQGGLVDEGMNPDDWYTNDLAPSS